MKMPAKYKAQSVEKYWSLDSAALIKALKSNQDGLPEKEAADRLSLYGPNALTQRRQFSAIRAFLSQVGNPLVLVLIFAAAVSLLAGEWIDAGIVIVIVLISSLLSFLQEYSASHAVEELRSKITIKTTVIRDGKENEIPAQNLVPGDIVLLSSGSLVPADGALLSANSFYVNQAVLTGETFPVEKRAAPSGEMATLTEQTNVAFMGTNVRSGTARMLVVQTGAATQYGRIAGSLLEKPEETEFERGIRGFGLLLTRIVLVLVLAVLAVNLLLKKPIIDTLLFAIALAVGIAPELLPAIMNINLSKGAQAMAKSGVIVRRLNAIENLGSMDILCTDKTGTITQGVVNLDSALDYQGKPSDEVMRWACLNASLQTGIRNPLDEAIMRQAQKHTAGMDKLAEIPFDFTRKRLSVVVDKDPGSGVEPFLITKGALENILAVCSIVKTAEGDRALDKNGLDRINQQFTQWSGQGFRVVGIAVKPVARQEKYSAADDEQGMAFMGFLLFFDPPKEGVAQTIAGLKELGVDVKVITGDNHLVARHVAQAVGLASDRVLSAKELDALSNDALTRVALETSVFAGVDPNQKERIIHALKRSGHVVGYMGDGINDAPALISADIGISVDTAVDVAKEAADFVLLKKDLNVLIAGIREGRRTFANTLKYIYTTISANFGNMLSMAGASLFLPFLPLLAKQILLNNFLSDIPAIGVPGDAVDPELVEKPRQWNLRGIRNFMIIFGLVSSLFDYAAFGLLMLVARAKEPMFQTGWFVESLLTELVVALVVRTRRLSWQSRPGRLLMILTLFVAVVTFALPYLPFAGILGFTPLPAWLMLSLAAITVLYAGAVEITKKMYYRRFPG
ncbi:MAG: magnesium-translocating P-type ATPase [Eubacteriales bacterium]|nr:magnesium-translocating P-type ATPase [Eubacteriales bacterium]